MDFEELLAAGETTTSARLEKYDRTCIDTVCALANAAGGIILIGVSSAGNIVGVEVDEATINDLLYAK